MANEEYREHMLFKRNTYNSVLVLPKDDFGQFFIDYFITKDNQRIEYYDTRTV